MKTLKDKQKQYPHWIIITDDGFSAMVYTPTFSGVPQDTILVFSNDDGDGKYGKPVASFFGSDIKKITDVLNVWLCIDTIKITD